MKVFITIDEVLANRSQYQLVDVRYKTGSPGYGKAAHEKIRPTGCLFCDLEADGVMKDAKQEALTGARHALPNVKDFIAWCERNGIGKKTVVCFDDCGGGGAAGRFFWQLVVGMEGSGIKAHMLDGGWHAYAAAAKEKPDAAPLTENQPMSTAPSSPDAYAPGSAPYSKIDKWSHTATIDEIAPDKIGGPLFDARPAARFPIAPRPIPGAVDPMAGHIPHAQEWAFPSFLTGPPDQPATRLRPKEEILALIKSKIGDAPIGDVVLSCGSAVTACLNYAAILHVLDLEPGRDKLPRLYPGSFSEYSKLKMDVVVASHIAAQGFALALDKTLPAAPELGLGDDSGDAPVVVVTVNGKGYRSVAAALADYKGDAQLPKILPLLHRGENGKIFTGDAVYVVSA